MCSRGVRREWLTILRFPLNRDGSESEPPTVYADGYTGDLYLDKPTEVASYDAAFKDIRDKAIDDQASQNLISEVAGSYGQG
ncbi:Scr1 family TA system antitoxin-like transcriptional regulator [Streptomyces finlayi]|nr:Scr1 family TA system antitoxin-like transcriptional regulator [Streptomyces finlayi]